MAGLLNLDEQEDISRGAPRRYGESPEEAAKRELATLNYLLRAKATQRGGILSDGGNPANDPLTGTSTPMGSVPGSSGADERFPIQSIDTPTYQPKKEQGPRVPLRGDEFGAPVEEDRPWVRPGSPIAILRDKLFAPSSATAMPGGRPTDRELDDARAKLPQGRYAGESANLAPPRSAPPAGSQAGPGPDEAWKPDTPPMPFAGLPALQGQDMPPPGTMGGPAGPSPTLPPQVMAALAEKLRGGQAPGQFPPPQAGPQVADVPLPRPKPDQTTPPAAQATSAGVPPMLQGVPQQEINDPDRIGAAPMRPMPPQAALAAMAQRSPAPGGAPQQAAPPPGAGPAPEGSVSVQPQGGFFSGIGNKIDQNRNALLLAGAGLAGAPSAGIGISRGLMGIAQGQQLDRSQQAVNMTTQALIRRGMSPVDAQAVAMNPEVLKQVLPQLFGSKTGININGYLVDPSNARVMGDFSDTNQKGPDVKEIDGIPHIWNRQLQRYERVNGNQTPAAAAQTPAGAAAPPEIASLPMSEQMRMAPEGSVFRIGQGRFQKVNGKMVPYRPEQPHQAQ